MKNDTALITAGQMKDLSVALLKCVPTDLSFEDAQYWIEHKGSLTQKVGDVLKRSSEDIRKENQLLVSQWGVFYNKYFGFTPDLRDLKIPEREPGFDRLIIVRSGLTPNQVFEVCQKHFPCEKYGIDLDKATKGKNEREPMETYAIWVRDSQEPDEGLLNLSAEAIEKRKVKTETLLERELHELKFFSESDKHLDEKNITLCSGSRNSNGGVPRGRWCDGRFEVSWSLPQFAFPSLGARTVVSLPPKAE